MTTSDWALATEDINHANDGRASGIWVGILPEGRKGAFVELPTWRTPDPGAIPVLQVGNGGWLGTPDLGFRSRPSDCP